MKKRFILLFFLLVVISSILIIYFNLIQKDEKVKINDISEKKIEQKEKKDSKSEEDNSEQEEIIDKESVKDDTVTQDNNSTSSKDSGIQSNTNNNVSTGSTYQQNNNVQNSNTNSQNNSTTQTTQPSCISKKFISNWFRADFSSMSACQSKGNQYMDQYGYWCDEMPDDCGVNYYMLNLYEKDTGVSVDYRNIPR